MIVFLAFSTSSLLLTQSPKWYNLLQIYQNTEQQGTKQTNSGTFPTTHTFQKIQIKIRSLQHNYSKLFSDPETDFSKVNGRTGPIIHDFSKAI